MKTPGADADENEADVTPDNGRSNREQWWPLRVELRVEASVCRMSPRPVDAVEREQYHYQIGHRVPELGNVVRHCVVRLAPVDRGRVRTPEAFNSFVYSFGHSKN